MLVVREHEGLMTHDLTTAESILRTASRSVENLVYIDFEQTWKLDIHFPSSGFILIRCFSKTTKSEKSV